MRGADTFTESLLSMRKLGDFVPKSHRLRSIRVMANEALRGLRHPGLCHAAATSITGSHRIGKFTEFAT